MLYELFGWLADNHLRGFGVFEYITLRAVLACGTALVIGLIAGPFVIRRLTALKIGQAGRCYGPESHLSKTGTPTRGGVASVYLTFAISAPATANVWPLIRDWVASGFTMSLPTRADLIVPFFKSVSYPLGVFGFVALTWIVIVGTSNAVNLTDGLDGLAIMPTVMVGAALGVFAYVIGRTDYSRYLLFPYLPGSGELMVLCAALAGAGLAFLWFNAYPAQVFMGDVGALALGGMLGTIAVVVRQEIVLFIMGGVFVAETLSVMIQVTWFKYTKRKYGQGRRILRMAPLHHHFEVGGWKETQVVVRFWIISMMLVLVGLSSLKIR